MKCFDAHSDIWTDVTIRRLKGETNVFHDHHFERLQKGGVEGSMLDFTLGQVDAYANVAANRGQLWVQ